MHWANSAFISPILAAFVAPRTGPPFSLYSSSSTTGLSSTTNSLELVNVPVEPSKYDALLEWIKKQDGAMIHPSISISSSSLGGGYGVFVDQDIAEGELLFTIPRSACVTLEDATSDPLSGTAFSKLIEKAGPGGNTVVLAGFLARERLRSLQHALTPETLGDSSYGPYLDTLPWERGINNQEHTLYWKESDIEALLPGTMCYEEIGDLRAEVDLAISILNGIMGDTVRELRGEIDEAPSGFQWPWEAAETKERQQQQVAGLAEAIKGAFVSLLTRSFQDGAEDQEKLVPLLDILQHADDPNISHVMEKSTGAVQVTAKQALKAGDELLNQYRSELEESMPYHRFFTRFGFVPGISDDDSMENLLREKSSIFFAQKAEI